MLDEYNRLVDIARDKNARTGWNSSSELTPEFIGHEGKRVEVTDKDGTKRRYIIGKSTGFIPCHLEITRRNNPGGVSVTGFKSFKFIN